MRKATPLILALLLCVATMCTMMLSVSAASTSGYCAVGEVGSGKAAILLGDGSIVEASFTGTAPVSGTVMSYTETDGTYTFGAVSLGGYHQWRIYDNDDENGDFYYGNDGVNEIYAFIDATAVGFVKFSNTSWRVYRGNHMIEIAEGVGDYPNTVWTANVDAQWNNDLQKMDLLFADCTFAHSSGPANPSVLFNGTATPDTTGDKNVVLSAGGGTTTEPEPPVAPEVLENDFCAVGEVDTEAGLAAVLFEDGTVATVRYTGTAPKSGAIHLFKKVGDAFEFVEKMYEPTTVEWRVYDHLAEGDGDNTDFVVSYDAAGNETRVYFRKDCVTFIKFSDTNWSMAKGGQVVNIKEQVQDYPHTVWPFGVMFSIDTLELQSRVTRADSLFCDATSSKAATALFTADQKEMTEGEFNLVIERNNVTSPETADIGIAISAVALATACISVAVIRRRKHNV